MGSPTQSAKTAAFACGEVRDHVSPHICILLVPLLASPMPHASVDIAARTERGQLALEQGHVCVLNATALATEVIKNLVLPGVGKFTVVDNQRVTGTSVSCPHCFGAVLLLRSEACS